MTMRLIVLWASLLIIVALNISPAFACEPGDLDSRCSVWRLTRKLGVAIVTAGVGTPFAIAAKLVHPKSNVIVINGDGVFGLNGFEFDTAVRFNLPVVSVIGNDAAWGQIRGPQMNFYGANLKDCFASLAMTICKSKIGNRKSESIN